MFEYQITNQYKKARRGIFTTPHGQLQTPELSFVATKGEVKAIPRDILPNLPINLIIVNTFHIFVKNIMQTSHVKLQNPTSNFQHPTSEFDIHNYSGFPRVIESDSGGFQVFSLGFGKSQGVGKVANIFPGAATTNSDIDNPLTINEEGVTFKFNSQSISLTPEKSMDIQQQIGADIIFAFDECTSPLNTKEYTANSLERTHRWLLRCIKKHQFNQSPTTLESVKSVKSVCSNLTDSTDSTDLTNKQALFGIVQGGAYEDLRIKSAKFLSKLDVPGYGIGGSLGKTKEDVLNVLEWTNAQLPNNKPRHLLGIGQVRDIFESVERGVDMFDCVIPTREARHKVIYTKKGKINVRKMKNINEVIDNDCLCAACSQKITYQQLAQLFSLKDPRCIYFSTVHNIYFYSNMMKEIRQSIELATFDKLKDKYLKYY